jgi:cobalt-zinc-cadmium efflux system outer membrane protein
MLVCAILTGAAGCPSIPPVWAPPLVALPLKEHDTLQRTVYTEAAGGQKEANGEKKGGHDEKKNGDTEAEKITLPLAIEMCVNQNFRVRAGAEKIAQAQAEFVTASLIPNPSLLADSLLIPLQTANIDNQLGPPQWDVLVSLPIDWLLFGKRVAGMRAAKLGIDVSEADQADLLRVQLARTVDSFYEVLADEEYLKLAHETHDELVAIEKLTQDLAKNKKAGDLELNRLKLAILEAFLEIHERERNLAGAKARLRPLIGRSATDADFEVDGPLTVKAVVPPPKLADALALADIYRPDLISDRHDINRGLAGETAERRRAWPLVSVYSGWTYQDQRHIDNFRNGSMINFGLSTTLPLTDRNQGNIRRAQSHTVEMQMTYLADRAEALAEVEATLADYEDAVEDVTRNNSPVTLKAAHELWKSMEAGYRAGDRRLVELLDAHRAYRERVAHVVEFESMYWRKLNRMNMVVGLKAYDPAKGPTIPVEK